MVALLILQTQALNLSESACAQLETELQTHPQRFTRTSSGTWDMAASYAGRTKVISTTSSTGSLSLAATPSWSDYSATMWMILADMNGGLGILGRVIDKTHNYPLEPNNNDDCKRVGSAMARPGRNSPSPTRPAIKLLVYCTTVTASSTALGPSNFSTSSRSNSSRSISAFVSRSSLSRLSVTI